MTLEDKLIQELVRRSRGKKFPDGTEYRSVSLADVLELAEMYATEPKEVEIAALARQIVPERYVRNLNAFCIDDQINLLKSHVCIVGAGGLGGGVIETLARAGVGKLVLIDGDCFEEHNLNRQLMSSEIVLGKSKVEVAKKRVESINASISVTAHLVFLDETCADKLIGDCHVVVDCLDNIHSRLTVEKAAKKKGIPMVTAAVAGSSGHLTTVFPEDKGLSLIYGDAEEAPEKGAETSLGCLPNAVMFLSAMESSEVLKILTGSGSLLRNKLMVVDLAANSFDVFQL
jgi:molybdopterin/thiamine biosynthesis adenylyltransferase